MVSFLYQGKCLLSLNSSISLPLFNIKDTLINKIKVSILLTFTEKSIKEKIFSCGNLANRLPNRKFPPVIYNTPFTGAGFCQGFFSSPSIDWSAFGQALFQKVHFTSELFGKERSSKIFSYMQHEVNRDA